VPVVPFVLLLHVHAAPFACLQCTVHHTIDRFGHALGGTGWISVLCSSEWITNLRSSFFFLLTKLLPHLTPRQNYFRISSLHIFVSMDVDAELRGQIPKYCRLAVIRGVSFATRSCLSKKNTVHKGRKYYSVIICACTSFTR
jgi:hypothetical protein